MDVKSTWASPPVARRIITSPTWDARHCQAVRNEEQHLTQASSKRHMGGTQTAPERRRIGTSTNAKRTSSYTCSGSVTLALGVRLTCHRHGRAPFGLSGRATTNESFGAIGPSRANGKPKRTCIKVPASRPPSGRWSLGDAVAQWSGNGAAMERQRLTTSLATPNDKPLSPRYQCRALLWSVPDTWRLTLCLRAQMLSSSSSNVACRAFEF